MTRTTHNERAEALPRENVRSALGADPARNLALGVLVVIHALGALGSPIAASLHVWQAGATDHQNFHVVWEAFKYFTASILAIGLVLGPLRAGKRWALWLLGAGSVTLFGGVYISHALTGGGPLIDFVAYGAFLVLSLLALGVLAVRSRIAEPATRPTHDRRHGSPRRRSGKPRSVLFGQGSDQPEPRRRGSQSSRPIAPAP